MQAYIKQEGGPDLMLPPLAASPEAQIECEHAVHGQAEEQLMAMANAFYVLNTHVYLRAPDSALDSYAAAAAAAAAAAVAAAAVEKVWAQERHHMKPSSDLQLLQI